MVGCSSGCLSSYLFLEIGEEIQTSYHDLGGCWWWWLISQSNFPLQLTKIFRLHVRKSWTKELSSFDGDHRDCWVVFVVSTNWMHWVADPGNNYRIFGCQKRLQPKSEVLRDTVWGGLEEGWRNTHWEIWLCLCRRQMSCTPAPIIENIQMHVMMILTSRIEHDKLLFCSR